MIKKTTFKILWHIAWKFGYDLQDRRISPTPLKTYGNDPRELPYLRDWEYSILNLPTELGVGLRFFPLIGKTYHPYILALKEIGKAENHEKYVFEILKIYNQLSTLKTANDFLGLSKGEECFSNNSHPYEYTYPWTQLLPHEVKEINLGYNRRENIRHGLVTDEALGFSIASDEKVRIEAKRLVDLMISIQKHGFKPQYPDSLGCFVLSSGDKWKWYVKGGQHRASVLAALGHDKIPVHVRQLVRREDVCFWPNVQSGIFSEERALVIFDKLFAANPPPVSRDWVSYVNETFDYMK